MKKNRIILVVTVILIAVAVVLILTQRKSTLRKGESDFALKDTASVTRIFLVDKNNNSVLLEKTGPSDWQLNKEYKAHDFLVKDFLKSLMDLKVRYPVPRSARDNIISRLSVKAIKVEIYQVKPLINLFGVIKLFPREKRTKTYFVGGPTQDNMGTFMLMEDADQPYVVYIPRFRGFVAARYSTMEEDWRDHTIFSTRLENIKKVSLKFLEEPDESYAIEYLGDDNFIFTPSAEGQPRPFDTLKVLNFLTSFRDIRFEALLNYSTEQSFIDSVTSQKPAHIITLIDRSGDTTEAVTYRKSTFAAELRTEEELLEQPFDIDRFYALINEGEDFVLIQYFVFDRILRPASYFYPDN